MSPLAIYKNGNYRVILYEDGTKVRITDDDDFIPQFSENVDITLTRKCSQGCKLCYDNCTPEGKHGRIDYKFLDTLHAGTEVALNGNDLDHPQLEELLLKLKDKKVIPNITVNYNQFIKNIDTIKKWQDEGLVYGVGISLNSFTDDKIEAINSIKNSVIHTIAGICKDYSPLYDKNAKVLILGYKDKGRGIEFRNPEVDENISKLNNNLSELVEHVKVLSFDNLAIEQLPNVKNIVGDKWGEFYMGDDGKFTFYIDLVNGTFAKNSCIKESFPIMDSIDDMFDFIRKKYESTN